jgi:hypothetical protein
MLIGRRRSMIARSLATRRISPVVFALFSVTSGFLVPSAAKAFYLTSTALAMVEVGETLPAVELNE